MDDILKSCPPMDFTALEDEILSTVLADDNYLFYRTNAPFDGLSCDVKPMWELHCTACHQSFFVPKKRGYKPSELAACPECGAKVTAKRWMRRNNLQTRILYYKLQRGAGRQIWLHAYAVTHSFCPDPGDERLEFWEMSRYLFDDGTARKWTHSISYFGRMLETVYWQERKRVTRTVWQQNCMAGYPPYPAYIGEISMDTIRGSCLAYSQLDLAIEQGYDIPEYLDYYIKNPMIEHLWKQELDHLLWEGLMHDDRAGLRSAVNLKAKRPQDLFRGLNRAEVRRIAMEKESIPVVITYKRLKKAGIVSHNDAGWLWARTVARNGVPDKAARHGIDGKALRAYIERQNKRHHALMSTTLHDYGDYLDQLDRLGAEGGEPMPHDLQAAHERLSMRLNRVKDLALNQKFRARRRLYNWLCWRHDGCFIRPIDSVQEITREGENQRNCVAGYAKRHADGDTIIMVLRRASDPCHSWHTVEIDPQTLAVKQCRGYRNMEATPEAAEFMEFWKEHLRELGRYVA